MSPVVKASLAALASTLMALGGGSSARAVGQCENLQTSYEVQAIASGGAFILVEASREWCNDDEESDLPEPPDGETWLVFNKKGKVTARFESPAPSHGVRSDLTMGASVKPQSLAALKAWRKKHPWVPAGPALNFDGDCSQSIATKNVRTSPGSFGEAKATFVIRRGRKKLWSKPLGVVGVDGNDEPVASLKLFRVPGANRLVMWTETGLCEGPPPGYFGPDDAGECYKKWSPALKVISAPPKLKKCKSWGKP